ncbi:uncharacterized protein NPIL_251581 [Nephila pilipes]|uniref:Uncharacterized protein n=1 Tax=Nephila pilipes TaxID=299642 RepID=A0A8X6MBF3_NEPPI|nr:uncharacterized protein NPIL_251581 [Nephila pilipes]
MEVSSLISETNNNAKFSDDSEHFLRDDAEFSSETNKTELEHEPSNIEKDERQLHQTGKKQSFLEEGVNEAMKSPSLSSLNVDWLNELAENVDKEPFLLTKTAFVTQCSEISECLNYLLSSEMTNAYVSMSQLFKTFRLIYSSNQKLRNKTFELMAQTQTMSKLNDQLVTQVLKRDEKIKYLEVHFEEHRGRTHLAEKSKFEIELKLKELEAKYKEKSLKRSEKIEDPDLSASEIDVLYSELNVSRNKVKSLENEVQQSKEVDNELREEIKVLNKKLENISQKRQEAQVATLAKSDELQQQLEFTKSLQQKIESLKTDLEASKKESENLVKELKISETRLKETSYNSLLLKKNIGARQFHLTVMKTKNEKLEQINKEKQLENSRLEMLLSKVTVSKNDLTRKVDILEQKLREVHYVAKEKEQTTTFQKQEIEIIKKTESNKDKTIRQLKEDLRKFRVEYCCLLESMKKQSGRLKGQETLCWDLKKDLEFNQQETNELKIKINLLEDKNAKLSSQILELSATKSGLEDHILSLDQSNKTKSEEIFKLKQELAQEKEDSRFSHNAEYDTKKQLEITKVKLKEVLHFQHAFTESTQQQMSRIKILENQILKLQKEVNHLVIQNNNVRCTLSQLQSRNKELCKNLESKERDHLNTLKTLEETERELEFKKHKYHSLAAEKSTSDLKLSEKIKELAKKNENIEQLAFEISKINQAVSQKENEIKLCKTEIQELHRVQNIARNQLQEKEYLKKEIVVLNNLLASEKLKSKTTEEELQKPINMHRWRMLSGSEMPQKYLMLKCINLQKLLTRKSDVLTKKENELTNKEKVIEELQADKKKREDLNVEKKLWLCQKELSDCKKEIKCLLGEKLVYESMSAKYESQIKNLNEQLKNIRLSKR